jgi:hypothetical protein
MIISEALVSRNANQRPFISDESADVDLSSYDSNTGLLTVTDANLGANSVSATFTGTTVCITISLAFLSGPGTGIVDAAVIVGSPIEATDCAPDGGFLTSGPSPALAGPTLQEWGMALLCGSLILAGLGVMRRRRTCGSHDRL